MLMRYQEASIGVGQNAEVAETSDSALRVGLSHAPADPPDSVDEPAYLPVVRLKGVELHAITEKQCIDHILRKLDERVGGTVVTPNLDILRRCTKDLMFATLVSESDLVVADGMPLVWASRIQGTPLPERIAGSDLISTLSAAAARRGRTIFLLGGDPGAAQGAAEILCARNPQLKVAGTYVPPYGFEKKPEEMSKLIDALTQAKPDIVWVALGSPKQEQLINRIRQVLPASWWLGVGISFSFLTGDVQRAPRWVQLIGMEWLHRVVQEPQRLFKRYFVHGLPFAASLVVSAVANRRFGAKDSRAAGHRHRSRKRLAPAASTSPAPTSVPDSAPSIVRTPAPEAASSEGDRAGDLTVFTRSDSTLLGRGLKRLKAVILLGGKVRESPLSMAIGRSRLDLPLDETGTILNHWLTQCDELARRAALENLLVRVTVDQTSHEPKTIDPRFAHMVRVERDQSSFRGTGGLIADIAADYADDDLLLVGNAHQVLLDPLWAIAAALDHKTGDFTLISHRDGTASGLMLLTCRTVREISQIGYIDLKEQALPTIAKRHDVRVVHCRQPTGLPLFTLADYITSLQQHYRRRERKRARAAPLSEDYNRHFAIVEDGATVAPDAYLHDAVILRGATVEAGAAAIRSLVCPGAAIRRGKLMSDQLVS
jgi:N-acetylglucosaminyldiphosphoundecaprenol N-acetyl-beta-D-mannosaminyltransferase